MNFPRSLTEYTSFVDVDQFASDPVFISEAVLSEVDAFLVGTVVISSLLRLLAIPRKTHNSDFSSADYHPEKI